MTNAMSELAQPSTHVEKVGLMSLNVCGGLEALWRARGVAWPPAMRGDDSVSSQYAAPVHSRKHYSRLSARSARANAVNR